MRNKMSQVSRIAVPEQYIVWGTSVEPSQIRKRDDTKPFEPFGNRPMLSGMFPRWRHIQH